MNEHDIKIVFSFLEKWIQEKILENNQKHDIEVLEDILEELKQNMYDFYTGNDYFSNYYFYENIYIGITILIKEKAKLYLEEEGDLQAFYNVVLNTLDCLLRKFGKESCIILFWKDCNEKIKLLEK